MLKWHERQSRKLSKRNLDLAIFGKFLFVIAIGSIFSRELIAYGYYLLIIATFFMIHYVSRNFLDWHSNKKISYSRHIFGYLGGALLALFFGMQTTQLPFKNYILGLGIIMTLPGLIQIIKNH